MIQTVEMQFDLSSNNELTKMTVLEQQIITMHEIAEQLIAMSSDLADDHNRESLTFKQEFKQMVQSTFDL